MLHNYHYVRSCTISVHNKLWKVIFMYFIDNSIFIVISYVQRCIRFPCKAVSRWCFNEKKNAIKPLLVHLICIIVIKSYIYDIHLLLAHQKFSYCKNGFFVSLWFSGKITFFNTLQNFFQKFQYIYYTHTTLQNIQWHTFLKGKLKIYIFYNLNYFLLFEHL